MKEKPSFEASMRALLRAKESSLQEHPTLPDLIRYRDGAMPEALQERTRDHLTVCRACVQTLLELERAVAERGRADLSEERLAGERDSLAAIRRRLESERTLDEPVEDPPKVGTMAALIAALKTFFGSLFAHRTLGLAAACVLLLAWGIALQIKVRELSSPRVVESLPELLSPEAATVRGERGLVASFGSAGGDADLILGLPGGGEGSVFVVEIVEDSSRRPRWSSARLAANPPRDVAIHVPAGFLARGQYQVRLYEIRGSARDLVFESPLKVE